jgi:hypothetical protein
MKHLKEAPNHSQKENKVIMRPCSMLYHALSQQKNKAPKA